MLQASDLELGPGQSDPPLAAGVATDLEAVLWPVPQGREQELQAAQVLQAQLTAHGWALQVSDLVLEPSQLAPPLAAWVTTDREEERVPPPQRALQSDQACHSDQTQFTGAGGGGGGGGVEVQAWVLHCSEEVELPKHSLPPLAAGVAMPLVLVLAPVPQGRLHSDQEPHWAQTQATGQG